MQTMDARTRLDTGLGKPPYLGLNRPLEISAPRLRRTERVQAFAQLAFEFSEKPPGVRTVAVDGDFRGCQQLRAVVVQVAPHARPFGVGGCEQSTGEIADQGSLALQFVTQDQVLQMWSDNFVSVSHAPARLHPDRIA